MSERPLHPPYWMALAWVSAMFSPPGLIGLTLLAATVGWMMDSPLVPGVFATLLLYHALLMEMGRAQRRWEGEADADEQREVAKLRFEHAVREAKVTGDDDEVRFGVISAIGQAMAAGVEADELRAIVARLHGQEPER